MKTKLFILAAFALMAASCAKTDMDTPEQNNGRTLALTASLPTDGPESRMAYATDGTTPDHGLTLKWTEGDKLHLCFEHGGQFYHADTEALQASHITTDGKRATFTVTVPDEIPDGDTFTFHAVYQHINTWSNNNGGYFETGTATYIFENSEEECVTLDKTGGAQNGIIRPALHYTQANATAATLGDMAFGHLGWVMALTFTNNSGVEMKLPTHIELRYGSESATSFIWNGYHGTNTVKMDLDTGTASSNAVSWDSKASVYFIINKYSWNPLSGQKLAAGASITLYRWVLSTPRIEPLRGELLRQSESYSDQTSTVLPAKTVENGKVYHLGLAWDGSTLSWD